MPCSFRRRSISLPPEKKFRTPSHRIRGIKPTVEIRQAVEEALDLTDDDAGGATASERTKPHKDEDRQLNKAIEILKDPSKISTIGGEDPGRVSRLQ